LVFARLAGYNAANDAERYPCRGVFDRIFAGLAGEGSRPQRIMIDSTRLKAHSTAASLLKKGLFPVVSGARKAD